MENNKNGKLTRYCRTILHFFVMYFIHWKWVNREQGRRLDWTGDGTFVLCSAGEGTVELFWFWSKISFFMRVRQQQQPRSGSVSRKMRNYLWAFLANYCMAGAHFTFEHHLNDTAEMFSGLGCTASTAIRLAEAVQTADDVFLRTFFIPQYAEQ